MRTINGIDYITFQAAALALNLIDNDEQWRTCLQNAIETEHPSDIRFLFATICMHSLPIRPTPLELWEHFKMGMSDDFLHKHNSVHVSINKALQASFFLDIISIYFFEKPYLINKKKLLYINSI